MKDGEFDFGDKTARHLSQQMPQEGNQYQINVVNAARYLVECGYKDSIYNTQYNSGSSAWVGKNPEKIIKRELLPDTFDPNWSFNSESDNDKIGKYYLMCNEPSCEMIFSLETTKPNIPQVGLNHIGTQCETCSSGTLDKVFVLTTDDRDKLRRLDFDNWSGFFHGLLD